MILFDSHAHIDDKCYDNDLKDVIDRAENEGLCGIMIKKIASIFFYEA